MKRKNMLVEDLVSISDWKEICTREKINLELKFVKGQSGTSVNPWLELKPLNPNILPLLLGKMCLSLEESLLPAEL